jgi:DNA-directed RNA polymerase specialized sigma24 family protein
MGNDPKQKALVEVQRAQRDYERNVNTAREARRKSFARAQKAGLSLRDIGEAVGLHRSRVGEILRGE